MYQKKLAAWFAAHQEEIVEAVKRLVRIPSVAKPELAQPGAPFGPACRQAMEEAEKLARELGFQTRILEGYALEVDMNGREPQVGILAHLDVVPEGDGWETGPYDPQVRDGYIFGRGTDDDKGPAVIALYAMKAAMELAPDMVKGCRLILGSAEEIGSPDLNYYLKDHRCPPHTFSPDADYPVINLEKGSYRPRFGAKWEPESGACVRSIRAGQVTNVVPKEATALVQGLTPEQVLPVLEQVSATAQVTLTAEEAPGGIRILARGLDAHASTPWLGHNALTALLQALAALPLDNTPSTGHLRTLARLFPHGDWRGAALGVAMEDDLSGPLTLNLSICNWNPDGFEGRFDSRVPVCGNPDNVKGVADGALARAGMPLTLDTPMRPHHYVPENDPFVQTLLSVYTDHTGQPGQCLAIGGGTYAHGIPGAVAFGCAFPGDPPSNLHSANERVSIARLLQSGGMFADVILRECGRTES